MNLSIIRNYFTPTSVLDIGANVGQFYKSCKEVFPNCYYYLIEGNDNCEEDLITLNVDFSISLLSDTEKYVDFYTRKNDFKCTGSSIYREKTPFYNDGEIRIIKKKTTVLDQLLPDKQFDLIKIDVQGSEMDIILGGLNLIKKSMGVILEVSLVEYNENSPHKSTIYEIMNKLDFLPVESLEDITSPYFDGIIQENILFVKK